MTEIAHSERKTRKPGLVLHNAFGYDLLVWLFTRGRENAFRETILGKADLQPGETVLDIGCGTGNLAIAAKKKVGPTGTMHGIDASPEMIARGRKKAKKIGVDILFETAAAQELPFRDAQFDVVLSTLMFHHLSRSARQQCAAEIGRILKPSGRVLVVDFAKAEHAKRNFTDHFHRRHGHVSIEDIIVPLEQAGLDCGESGTLGMYGLQFVLAVPRGAANVIHAAD
jgi:ubiquinone/menaquinone biosynthesis C-methylase UbiE